MNDSNRSSPVGRGYGFYRIMLGSNPSNSPVSMGRVLFSDDFVSGGA